LRLDFNSLKSAISGAVRVVDENGAIRLFRFTKEQETFIKLNPDQVRLNYQKSLASASIKLDFYSDTENLKLYVNTYVATVQIECFIDILIDGELFAHEGYREAVDGHIEIKLKLPKTRKRITVYFPNLFRADVVSVDIDDGAEFTPCDYKRKFLFVGDSITQGYTAEYPSKSYANRVSRYFDASAINNSIGGSVFNAGIIDADLGFTPDLVFVAFGTNDWSKKKDVKKNSKEFIKKLTETFPSSTVIGITPIWRGDIEEKGKDALMSFEEMQKYIKDLYESYPNVFMIDGQALVPNRSEYFIKDILHPNDKGFEFYSKNLIQAIETLSVLK